MQTSDLALLSPHDGGAVVDPRKRPPHSLALGGLVFAMALLLAGCSSPAVKRQRLVAKPNMTFSDSAVFTYNSARLLPQLATGFAGSGGAQNSGCTSCR